MGNKIGGRITVVVNAYNEEKNIKDCIQSAHLLTDNIIVIDTQSTDKTIEIAKRMGAIVYSYPHSRFVEVSRAFSIRKANTDWVLLLDADERLTSELAQEIKKAIKETKFAFFKIPRKNFFAGRWLKRGGWYPDYVIKLIHKPHFVDWPKMIHAAPDMKGSCGLLQQPITHLSQPNLEHMVRRTIIYEDVESALLFDAKEKVKTATFFRKFFGELYRRLIKGVGFLDGALGIIESLYQAFSKTITYLFLYEKNQKSRAVGSIS